MNAPALQIRPKPDDTAAAFAARFGITVKALRVYERAGLITPRRTEAGWRVYDDAHAERLHVILALKSLGLPLKRMRELLAGRGPDLDAVLAAQEAALETRRRETAQALGVVRAARQVLAAGRRLSPDELSNLVRRTAMTKSVEWTPQLEAIAQRTYTPEQRQALAQRTFTPEDQARVQAGWTQVWADIDRIGADQATSEAGLAVARRALALIQEFTQGDAGLWNGAARFWGEVSQAPEAADQTCFDPRRMAFLSAGLKALKDRGEVQP
ncbi:MerR family transcriptional regulator [Caulobacter sp. 17J80-11]|uniref:MerR family transcriptional regulator n=1 Tax=Caulobacter sp. 17J80-11 TaxID=2763502 RepID=UPI001653BE03|nr:MerR family transcriptional regulator [Caulobacter sp. 17J80-11]MBC6980670.1 MerR family transcriptional regulator [Caulobacter sp. 17J80-11]